MPEEKTRSLRALDALNFCNAGIQTGLGPFLSVFYTRIRHWNPGQIGTLLACQSLTGILFQSVAGNHVDQSQHKKALTAAAAITVSLSALAIAIFPSYGIQVAVQLVIGLAVTVFPAVTSAFALGLVDHSQLTGRVARNESFTHTGNMIFALSAGVVGTMLALQGIFFAAAVFAAGMAVAVIFIRAEDVSDDAARGGTGEQGEVRGFRELFKDKRIIIFTLSIALFNISNGATLPLVGEILSQGNKKGSAWQVAASVVVAEAVMIVVALYAGKLADRWGRKPLFLIAFAFLAVRNALTVISHSPFYLISLQAFDGVAMAIYGVLMTLVVADLAKGTGRFNFLQGAVQSAMGLGVFASNSGFGWLAKAAGFNVSFWALSGVAVGGGILYQIAMPETKGEGEQENSEEEKQEKRDTIEPSTAA